MFKLNLLTPDKKIVNEQELDFVTFPAFAGELTVLPGHAPLMTTMEPGLLTYQLTGGVKQTVAVSWGYCQVSAVGVNILVETAAASGDLDIEVLKGKFKTQSERLLKESLDDEAWSKTQHEVARLRAEIDLVQRKH